MRLAQARERAGATLRLVESLPLGAAQLHIVEARDRTLLVGATAAGVTLIADLDAPAPAPLESFQSELEAAAEDLDSLDQEGATSGASEAVLSLDSLLRQAGGSIAVRAEGLRRADPAESESGGRARRVR